jgi:signal transduction histidine kinase
MRAGVSQMSDDLSPADLLRIGHSSLVGQVSPWLVHQAINPLNAAQGITQQLLEEYAEASELDVAAVCEDLRLVEAQGQRLYTIFGELRDFCRPLEIDPQPAPVDLAEVVRQAASFLMPLATRREAPITFDVLGREGDLQIAGVRTHLLTLFVRLLHNALVRTCDGEVHVTMQGMAGSVRVQITDSGIGPRGESIERLFATLHSANDQVAALGVRMAEVIVQSHGGVVSLEPRPEGGEIATIELPANGCAPPTGEG